MSKWYVSVGMRLSIDYDDIEADTKEGAEEIAKKHWHQKILTTITAIAKLTI